MSVGRNTTKSPAAPSRSLQSCWEVAARIYDSYSHVEFGAPEIAGVANLSANSGPAKSLVSDLKQYGLIDKVKTGRYVVSQGLKDAHRFGEGSQEFKTAMYEFVKCPPVFQKVMSDVKGKLPAEPALASTLRSTYSFNPSKAKKTAKALSESLEWTGVLDSKRNIIPRRLESLLTSGSTPAPEDDGSAESAGLEREPVGGKSLSLDIPLAQGRVAHVKYPFDLSTDEAKKIGAVLAAICG